MNNVRYIRNPLHLHTFTHLFNIRHRLIHIRVHTRATYLSFIHTEIIGGKLD